MWREIGPSTGPIPILALAVLITVSTVACNQSTTPTPTKTQSIASQDPTAQQREIGDLEGINFIVGDGSEATFTVEEKLSRVPLPSDAVVRTTALSGEVHFDGRVSVVEIDLHQLRSDQSRRDRFIRDRMFPNQHIATFILDNARPIPQGFTDGEAVTFKVTGQLDIRGVQVPIIFDTEARDDGDVIFVLGRTNFVWSDFGMTAPNILGFVQVTNEVQVEIILALRPESP